MQCKKAAGNHFPKRCCPNATRVRKSLPRRADALIGHPAVIGRQASVAGVRLRAVQCPPGVQCPPDAGSGEKMVCSQLGHSPRGNPRPNAARPALREHLEDSTPIHVRGRTVSTLEARDGRAWGGPYTTRLQRRHRFFRYPVRGRNAQWRRIRSQAARASSFDPKPRVTASLFNRGSK